MLRVKSRSQSGSRWGSCTPGRGSIPPAARMSLSRTRCATFAGPACPQDSRWLSRHAGPDMGIKPSAPVGCTEPLPARGSARPVGRRATGVETTFKRVFSRQRCARALGKQSPTAVRSTGPVRSTAWSALDCPRLDPRDRSGPPSAGSVSGLVLRREFGDVTRSCLKRRGTGSAQAGRIPSAACKGPWRRRFHFAARRAMPRGDSCDTPPGS